jgi:hypothetical protein
MSLWLGSRRCPLPKKGFSEPKGQGPFFAFSPRDCSLVLMRAFRLSVVAENLAEHNCVKAFAWVCPVHRWPARASARLVVSLDALHRDQSRRQSSFCTQTVTA